MLHVLMFHSLLHGSASRSQDRQRVPRLGHPRHLRRTGLRCYRRWLQGLFRLWRQPGRQGRWYSPAPHQRFQQVSRSLARSCNEPRMRMQADLDGMGAVQADEWEESAPAEGLFTAFTRTLEC